jgi:hypothetical protein
MAVTITEAQIDAFQQLMGPKQQIVQRCEDRPSLTDIKKRYVVAPVDRGYLALAASIFTGNAISDKEVELVGLSKYAKMKELARLAFSTASERYPGKSPMHVDFSGAEDKEKAVIAWVNNDGHRDAFRHMYWNALMAKHFDQKFASDYGTAHETGVGNQKNRMVMDLYNNEAGRSIAARHPNATDEELADLVQAAVSRGDAIVLNSEGEPAWSDQVRLLEHGAARDTPIPDEPNKEKLK